jgi:hypothetical protein
VSYDLPFWMEKAARLGGLGLLTERDVFELGLGVRHVYGLMKDGAWHSAGEIRTVAGGSEGLRRMRELRKHYDIEKQGAGGRSYNYRLKEKGDGKG